MGHKAKPVAPIYQPEVPARSIFFAATHRFRRHRTAFWAVAAIDLVACVHQIAKRLDV